MTSENAHDAMHWMVGVDGSESAKSAARWAIANAPGRAESICLVHAWNVAATTVYSPFAPIMLADTVEAVERTASDELEVLAAELAPDSVVPISRLLVQGEPSTVLLDVARRSAQLIVGARGAGLFDRVLLGSTSTRCATHATVPTVVVREQFDRPPPPVRHLVVGFDGSANALAAVDWACGSASPGSAVDIIAVWEFTPSLFSGEPLYYPDAARRARELFEEQLTALPTSARRDDIAVSTYFLKGSPRERLATCASEADLLVVGARGRGAIGSALLGSVSSWLLHHVDQPIAVIPQAVSPTPLPGAPDVSY